MAIKNLATHYPELGRVRLGVKAFKANKNGEQVSYPVKGEHLRFSSNDLVVLRVLADHLGGEPVEWIDGEEAFQLQTESATVPVLLPPDPLADTPTYEKWGKGGLIRRCDGERCIVPVESPDGGHMEERNCACLAEGLTPGDRDDVKKGACTVTVRIRLVLPFVPGIGIWLCTSHSWYAALELPGQVQLIEALRTKGQLVPAEFAIEQRTEKKPWEKFKRDFIVPVLRIRMSIHQLEAAASGGAAGALESPVKPSTAPALTAGTGEGGDGASPVETTAPAAIGNGSTKAPAAPAKRSGTAKGAATTTAAPPAAGKRSPWVDALERDARKRGMDLPELDAFIKCVVDIAGLDALNDHVTDANTVLAAMPRWEDYTLAYDQNGKPFFTEPDVEGAATR